MSRSRSPEELRASIEQNRKELGTALVRLRSEFHDATDWRRHIRNHQREVVVGAAVAGFVLGGGVAGFLGLFKRG